MFQPPPEAPASLSNLLSIPMGSTTLYRVWRAEGQTQRDAPWWFSSVLGEAGGRFDLVEPLGTMYTATSRVAALLEALQSTLLSLPFEELQVRRLAIIAVPSAVPPAADLCDGTVAGVGITAAIWAGPNRSLTQSWAAAIRRDGWWSLHAGIQHDPSGQLRAVAVFGSAGSAAPSLGGEWEYLSETIHDDLGVLDELAEFGVHVRQSGELPILDDAPESIL